MALTLHLENTMHEGFKQGEWVNYYTIETSVIKITSSWRHPIGLRLLGVESWGLSNCNALSTCLSTLVLLVSLNTLWEGD